MATGNKLYMARDQYGHTEHALEHPRKDLMERCGIKHAAKMYVDGKDGKTYHVGYVVGEQWFNLYEVTPFRKEA